MIFATMMIKQFSQATTHANNGSSSSANSSPINSAGLIGVGAKALQSNEDQIFHNVPGVEHSNAPRFGQSNFPQQHYGPQNYDEEDPENYDSAWTDSGLKVGHSSGPRRIPGSRQGYTHSRSGGPSGGSGLKVLLKNYTHSRTEQDIPGGRSDFLAETNSRERQVLSFLIGETVE